MLEKTPESPLDCKEIQPVPPKGNQSWIFTGRTDAEAETPVLWPPDVKNWLTGKDSDAGKEWRREEKETTEDEMVGWHHRLDGHEFEPALGVGDEQGGLACCSPWGRRELDVTEQLNWTELPFPPPGGLLGAGMPPVSPALASRFFTAEPPGSPKKSDSSLLYYALFFLSLLEKSLQRFCWYNLISIPSFFGDGWLNSWFTPVLIPLSNDGLATPLAVSWE